MNATDKCPHCSNPLPADSPEGLCPQCLLRAACQTQSASETRTLASTPGAFDDTTSSAKTVGSETGALLKYFGDYELIEKIAQGGMGVVWKARQLSLKRDIALKMIRAGALAGPEEVERFLREAEAAANLQHPNIVAIHEVGEHGGQHYFSMDYVAGRDLGAIVKDGALPGQSAARYVKIIAAAIHFAHQRGTLHRDLKPQNVLIDTSDQPRITDFGLAKILTNDSQLTQSGVVMGSPSYMPPEQAAGRIGDIGPASDVYSLGAMLYELLVGRPPFRAATAMATMREVIETEPIPPRKLKADVPPDLETVCLKCLEKSPSARYPSAQALVDELDRFLKGDPILARPASPVRKMVSWARRHPGVLAGLATLVMVALVFGVFYLVEANSFLRAQQANPSLARVRGPLFDSLQTWSAIGSLVNTAGIFLFFAMQRLSRGVSFNDFLERKLFQKPLQPLRAGTRNFAVVAGSLLVSFGLLFLAQWIRANVWEGEFRPTQFAWVYGPVYFGLAILGIVIRDYRLVHYGPPAKLEIGSPGRQLTAEQILSIRSALEEFDWPGAILRCRQAVPDASAREARRFVTALWMGFRAEQPQKFARPSLSLTTLNWSAMLICAWIEAVALGVLWYAMPPGSPAMAGWQFAFSFLFAVGGVAALGVTGVGKRLILLAPAVATLVLLETVVRPRTALPSHSIGLMVCGTLFGLIFMLAGIGGLGRRAFLRRKRLANP